MFEICQFSFLCPCSFIFNWTYHFYLFTSKYFFYISIVERERDVSNIDSRGLKIFSTKGMEKGILIFQIYLNASQIKTCAEKLCSDVRIRKVNKP